MPEGPEIRQATDAIARVLEGRLIEAADFNHQSLMSARRYIVGEQVESLECRGKALLTHFSSGRSLYSHNQLYGLWRVVPRGKLPKTNRVLRLALHTSDHSVLLYSATDISFWETDKINQHPFLQRLGPDVLAVDTDAITVLERLQSPGFRNRQLSSLYLDQSFVAGLGNYLRSEILFFARVNPVKKPATLPKAQLERLARNTITISQRSYRTGGITVPASQRSKKVRQSSRTYERDRFAVFARSGEPCRTCNTPISRSTLTSRRIYWCPTCQPA